MSQVHKENLSAVDNALPNRAGLDIEIFGMEGIPEDIVQQHTQRVLTNFHQAEAERRAATGNPAPGVAGAGGQTKKPKFESPSELKKRLAEHKAKLAAEHANGGSSGGGTPLGAGQVQPPALSQSPNSFVSLQRQYECLVFTHSCSKLGLHSILLISNHLMALLVACPSVSPKPLPKALHKLLPTSSLSHTAKFLRKLLLISHHKRVIIPLNQPSLRRHPKTSHLTATNHFLRR